MVADGATEGSDTEKEMLKVLGGNAPGIAMPGVQVANSIWLIEPARDDYVQHLKDRYAAAAFQLSGEDPAPINQWVAKITRGRITELLNELPPNPVMVLVNMVNFKGAWAEEFDPDMTRDFRFHVFDGSSRPCKMMFRKSLSMYYTETENAQVVRLPYKARGKGPDFLSAVIMLPKKEGPDALDALVRSLTCESWMALHRQLNFRTGVLLGLPRFSVNFSVELDDTLKKLGMRQAYIPCEGFLRMSDDPNVYLGLVAHQVSIQVNEEGTVASAATAAAMATKGGGKGPTVTHMTVDRPFLFLITSSSGSMVFMAKVTNPKLSGIESHM